MLSDQEIEDVVNYVKAEPRTVQDCSRLIRRSWVTTDKYLSEIQKNTGRIAVKVFRKGSHGALKVVYYNYSETLASDDLKAELFEEIRISREKTDFDYFEVFQFVPDDKKRAKTSHDMKEEFRKAKSAVYCFSGNLSYVNEDNMVSVFEELLERKVMIKILCRVDIASLTNLSKLSPLLKRYPNQIEIRHCYHPLRGSIIDSSVMNFKNEMAVNKYREGELAKNMKIYYEIYDPVWIAWQQKVFWNLFRSSMDYNSRLKQFQKFL